MIGALYFDWNRLDVAILVTTTANNIREEAVLDDFLRFGLVF